MASAPLNTSSLTRPWTTPVEIRQDVQRVEVGAAEGTVCVYKTLEIAGNLEVKKSIYIMGGYEVQGHTNFDYEDWHEMSGDRPQCGGAIGRPLSLPPYPLKSLKTHTSHNFQEGFRTKSATGTVVMLGDLWVYGDLKVKGDLNVDLSKGQAHIRDKIELCIERV